MPACTETLCAFSVPALITSPRVATDSAPPLCSTPVLINVSADSNVPWSLEIIPSFVSVVPDWIATWSPAISAPWFFMWSAVALDRYTTDESTYCPSTTVSTSQTMSDS
ncbi:hypothetical protein C8J98_102456 [Luteibacter sp. OK325]|uniref:hypothetical protein n=1 Tax=Luteibacter sp. OK325 TaxID=2135670 RepID=UPI000D48B8BB|nr:hypothetical protein [Luteibacter sp. OK325]PTR34268.1 hypothetical protein C8J98_102456 [Luteibacter sp. OK325]